ncbi:NAD-dependent epimerase/dehydratase family protein [Algoriphagus aquimarinus]|uniref:NAD-dependent epimerase/dehydratase n=1 Tax=Algoriphagus aquimarinus TaxID=237018 RepID=A0A5C7AB23_9BACT|nr:NAD-dependent epimerase/dehydratase [Algoriphagus aquimarinus]TXE02128.1 NAD-dependent epimerase/dehydratase [Algoriphagus aquimarinus]
MKKTIVITGINGFLGSHLASFLNQDYQVIGLVRDILNNFRIVDCNYPLFTSDSKSITNLFNRFEIYAVIHTATVYKPKVSIEELLQTNILLPTLLYEKANQYNVKAFINTDTFFNIENSKYDYLNSYTLSKQNCLSWLKSIRGNCKLINMKLHHMYGPNDAENKFVTDIINKLKGNQNKIALTPGQQKRDFIFISDVCEAYKVVLESLLNFSEDFNFIEYEVGTGNSISISDFVQKAKELSRSTTNLEFGALPYRENEIMDAKANNKELLQLGWVPKTNLNSGILCLL